MDNTSPLDLIAGGLAFAILLGGIVRLFQGISAFSQKK